MGNIEKQLTYFHIFLFLGHCEVYYIMCVKYSKKGLKGLGVRM
jgi:hypothetical protein